MNYFIKLSIVIILFSSCNNYNKKDYTVLDNTTSKSDTVKPIIKTLLRNATFPIIFEAAFFDSTQVSQDGLVYSFYNLDIGKIRIESGKIIACDPAFMYDASPFINNFPLGEFPVHLAMAKTKDDERVAFSRIVFSEKPIHKWEIALKRGQKPISIKDTNIYCYGVDAGAGIFIDSIANDYFEPMEQSEWESIFVGKAEKNSYRGFIHDSAKHNFATFSSGYGDGCYATYIAFDVRGNICQILTDFALVDWWKLNR